MGGPTHEWVGPPIVTHGANKGGPFFRGANRPTMHTNPLSKGEPIGWGAVKTLCTAMDSVAVNRWLNASVGLSCYWKGVLVTWVCGGALSLVLKAFGLVIPWCRENGQTVTPQTITWKCPDYSGAISFCRRAALMFFSHGIATAIATDSWIASQPWPIQPLLS